MIWLLLRYNVVNAVKPRSGSKSVIWLLVCHHSRPMRRTTRNCTIDFTNMTEDALKEAWAKTYKRFNAADWAKVQQRYSSVSYSGQGDRKKSFRMLYRAFSFLT